MGLKTDPRINDLKSTGKWTKTGVNVAHCKANAGNVIIGAMRNSVQPCEWAGRYFMNGGGHVIAAPPKADISH